VALRDLFLLDDKVVFLNHGSFGACPEPVFRVYQEWQRELERNPVEFLARRLEGLLDEARAELAAFVGADADGLAFLPNATAAVNAVARSLDLGPGDEVLTTDHEYGATEMAWRDVCERAGATYVRRPVDVPCASADDVAEAIWAGVTDRTRAVFVSHITSLTAIRMPVEEVCRRARAAGIVSVVDGAHGPGQLDLDLAGLGADLYAGNCHKWLCAPKGSGFVYAAPAWRERLRPPVVSWGATSTHFGVRIGSQGTRDPAAYLAVPAAIRFHGELLAGQRRVCHELLAEFRERLGTPLTPAGDDWFGQMTSVELPPCDAEGVAGRLREEYAIEALVKEWNGRPLLRVSVQAYNTREDLQRLAEALPRALVA
jgi:isopenicillin-N epimerase